jgi:hypothetical protein
MSFVTIRQPEGLTWNFLKCSRSRERIPMASSVEKEVRLLPSRAAVAVWWDLVRKVKMERQV